MRMDDLSWLDSLRSSEDETQLAGSLSLLEASKPDKPNIKNPT